MRRQPSLAFRGGFAGLTIVAVIGILLAGISGRWGVAQYGSVAAWVGAVLTVTAVSVALWKAGDETRQRVYREHREQAELISAWWAGSKRDGHPAEKVRIANHSFQPVYDVSIFVVCIQGGCPRDGKEMRLRVYPAMHGLFSVLPSGSWYTQIETAGSTPQSRFGVELMFTDRHGSHWIRQPNGQLDEVPVPAPQYYELDRPLVYSHLVEHGG